MSTPPLISVIVPVYNTGRYLRKCLDSICKQTYENLEILCVNDGSTDDSSAILEEYSAKDSRIKVFSQKNSGLSAARNTALQHASGKWITGVDSDDYLEQDTYEYALKGVSDEVDIICFGTHVVWERQKDNDSLNQYMELKYENIHKITPELILNTNVTFWSKLWRKSFIDRFEHKFPDNLWYEDNYFFFTLAPFARLISYMPEKKYYYIQRSGSITDNSTSPRTFDKLHIAHAILDFYKKNPLPSHLKNIDLLVFEHCFYPLYEVTPFPSSYHHMAQDVAEKSGLINRYPHNLRFFRKVPLLLRPFIKHTITKSSYGIFGLPIVTVTLRNNIQIIRLLGIKINKKEIPC